MKITITGPRSVGKTTVSKLLAKKLNSNKIKKQIEKFNKVRKFILEND